MYSESYVKGYFTGVALRRHIRPTWNRPLVLASMSVTGIAADFEWRADLSDVSAITRVTAEYTGNVTVSYSFDGETYTEPVPMETLLAANHVRLFQTDSHSIRFRFRLADDASDLTSFTLSGLVSDWQSAYAPDASDAPVVPVEPVAYTAPAASYKPVASDADAGNVVSGAITAQKILDIARAEIGTKESPAGSNRTKYGVAYGWNGVAWCAIFVWWCFYKAGATSLLPRKTASCGELMSAAKQSGLWVTKAYRPGDILIYDFPGGKATDHTGLCESVSGDTVTAIEGNTGTGNDANGGAVMRRTRSLSLVKGAVRPKYDA